MFNTKLGKLNLQTCIYNASGPFCTREEELLPLFCSNHTAAVLTKSCTLKPRLGNEEPRYYQNKLATINSTGLANLGYKQYIEMSYTFKETMGYHKPYIISVSGLSLEDNLHIISEFNNKPYINGIELNLSCPNIIGKPQIGYDFDAVDETLRKVFDIYNNKSQIFGLKLPPYFDIVHYDVMVDILKKYPRIDFLTCINSIGNGLIIDSNKECATIKPKNGYGGIGGKTIKPIALANVHKFYTEIGNKVDIIGCGGVTNGMDIFEHILCGASAVQIGSQYMREGPGCFSRLEVELREVMKKKGYNNIDEFKGKLKYL